MRIWLASVVNRLRGLLRAGRIERDLDEEMAFHLEAKARELLDEGMPEAEARLAARRAFGSLALATEDSRAAWRCALLDSILQDVRHGWRALRRTPVFAVAVVLTLALGIGANTAIFTLLDRVMLRSLPVEDPDALVTLGARPLVGLRGSDGPADRSDVLFSRPLFLDLQLAGGAYSGLAAASSFPVTAYLGSDSRSPGDPPEQANALLVSGNLFHVLGAPVRLGRPLTPADDTDRSQPVVVLSHGLWARRFGGDPDVLGRTVRANGTDYTVVGVAAPAFRGLSVGTDIDLWVPLAMQASLTREESYLADRDVMWLRIVGRMRPGIGIEPAEARTNELLRRFVAEEAGAEPSPETRAAIARLSTEVVPFGRGFSSLRSRWRRPLVTLMATVVLVLLIACANVGNLLLARGSTRRRELSMRLALGAGRRRLARQLFTESIMLAGLGGILGLLVAHWTVWFLLGVLSPGRAAAMEARPDGPVLLFAAAVTMLAALLFGLLPAVRSSRIDVGLALRNASATLAGDHRSWKLRQALVVFQVAVSLCLLVGAGLLSRSLNNLRSQDLGFHTDGVLVADIDPQGGGIDARRWPVLFPALLDRVRAIPGVSDASMSLYGVLGRARRIIEVQVDGHETRRQEDNVVQELFITSDYFDVINASLRAGRPFDGRDGEGGARVAIVSESFARHFFGDAPALGRRFGTGDGQSSRDIEIVGIAPNIKHADLWGEAPRAIYRPAAQVPDFLTSIEIRSGGDPVHLAAAVRKAVAEVSPGLPVTAVAPLAARLDVALRQEHMLSQLTAVFGLLAMMLAAVGLYGVLAYGVSQRANEIGVRLALGAGRPQVLWMILRQALAWVGLGSALGVVATVGLGRLLASLLFGLDPFDAATIAAAGLLLVAVSLVAAWWPALRAARLDPLMALRGD